MTLKMMFPQAPAFGTPTEIQPGVWWIRMPLPFALNHINLWLLEDGEGYTLVDTGVATPEVKAHWETICREFLENKPITRVICTHTHPDHIGMAGLLCEQYQAPLWMTAAEYLMGRVLTADLPGVQREDLVRFFEQHGLQAEKSEETGMARGGMFKRLVSEMPSAYRRISEGDDIAIGNHTWRVHVGFGHSPEHASLICESLGLMISGDMLLPKISTNVSVFGSEPEGNPLRQFLDSVKRMQTFSDNLWVLPSHGLPFAGIAERTQALLDHHEERLSVLWEGIEGEVSARDSIPLIFNRELDSHQLSFAIGEAIAHLHYLMYEGRLCKRIDEAGIVRFRRIC
jgi:glyoxylase-like metal-dependent hydrolase (beta-lactamase superfamily II)